MASEEGKEAVLEAVAKLLSNYDSDALTVVTYKSVKEQLAPEFSELLSLYKADVKSCIMDVVMKSSNADAVVASPEEQDGGEEIEETSDDGDDEDDSTDEVADEPAFAELPDEWKAHYGSVVWVRTSKTFPWWPAYIYDPAMLAPYLKLKVLKRLGKAHAILPFKENFERLSTSQKMNKRLQTSFTQSVKQAEEEAALPVLERFLWMHKTKRGSSKKKMKKAAEGSDQTAAAVAKKRPPPTETSTSAALSPAPKKKRPTPAKKKPTASASTLEDQIQMESSAGDDMEGEEDMEEDEEEEAEFDENDDDEYAPSAPKTKTKKTSSSRREKSTTSTAKEPSGTDVQRVPKRPSKSTDDKEGSKKSRSTKTAKGASVSLEADGSAARDQKKRPAADKARAGEAVKKLKPAEVSEADKEMQREKIKKLQQSSSEPVWKQIKGSGAGEGKGESKKVALPKQPVAAPVRERPVETKLQRATRLTGLIEVYLSKSPIAVESVTKSLNKIKDMDLSIDELKSSKFAEMLSTLRKHSNATIATEAKRIRQVLKQSFEASAKPAAPSQNSGPDKAESTDKVEGPDKAEPTDKVEGPDKAESTEKVKGPDKAESTDQTYSTEKAEPTPDHSDCAVAEIAVKVDSVPAARPSHPKEVTETATELLLSESSALSGCSRDNVQRIVAELSSAFPPGVGGDATEFTHCLHTLAYALNADTHAGLIERIKNTTSGLSIVELCRTPVENW